MVGVTLVEFEIHALVITAVLKSNMSLKTCLSFIRLGQGKAPGSLDVGCRWLLPAFRCSDAHPATQRVQRLGHATFASHPEDATVTFDSHTHLSNRQLPHTGGGGPVHGEALGLIFCLLLLQVIPFVAVFIRYYRGNVLYLKIKSFGDVLVPP